MSVSVSSRLISHEDNPTDFDIESAEKHLKSLATPILSCEKEIQLLHELTEFEMGQYLLENKGFNGYWTAYMILHGPKKSDLSPLEKWILTRAPSVKATQERFQIFQQQIQQNLKPGSRVASLPCGLMDDLLGLDFESAPGVELIGIDLDQNSLELAQQNASQKGITNVSFLKKDAWALDVVNDYDIVVSNGLNIYEADSSRVASFYQKVSASLKTGGVFVTSFLTLSPAISKESPWTNVNAEDALTQAALFKDVIQVKWQNYQTEAEQRKALESAGFTVIDVVYDSQKIFPTIVARKN